MKDLIYLKGFNEGFKSECTFEMFKDILMDVVDIYEHEFADYTDLFPKHYSCLISFEHKEIDINIRLYDVPPIDDPGPFDLYYNKIITALDLGIDSMSSGIKSLEVYYERYNKMKSIIEHINEYIVPVFKGFSNYYDLEISIDDDEILLCFLLEAYE